MPMRAVRGGRRASLLRAGGRLAACLMLAFTACAAALLPGPVNGSVAAAEQGRQAEAEAHSQALEEARRTSRHTEQSPAVTSITTVAPDILAVQIDAGRVVPSQLSPYKPEPGDRQKPGEMRQTGGKGTVLVRDGRDVGLLIGRKKDALVTFESMQGELLSEVLMGYAPIYQVSSADDPGYARPQQPQKVYLKCKPTDWALYVNKFPMRYMVYLVLPRPLIQGKSYTVDLSDLNVRQPRHTFRYSPKEFRSDAVHVNQIGFRPDDPVKRGFLSIWLGTGGAHAYEEDLKFELLDEATDSSVYSGRVRLSLAADQPERMATGGNYNKTDVYQMDFGDFRQPGRYRLYVEGVGCSYPFEIGTDVWESAFLVQMKGFYNERSGTELGPPYSQFRKPPDFNPHYGEPVYQSTYSILDEGDHFRGIEEGRTDELVPDAWGGYHDAGDWNPRRVTHLSATMLQLELMGMYPDYFAKLDLNIPHDYDVPDLLNEVLFELDLFRRLQKPDGGVPYGIETNGDPDPGTVSWHQEKTPYVYAPDIYSSYFYASAAARAARVLEDYGPRLSESYRRSGLEAMRWAEERWARGALEKSVENLRWRVRDARNRAALELYVLTRDPHWHDVFLQNTCLKDPNGRLAVWGLHDQRDAVFAYARLPEGMGDAVLKQTAVLALCAEADMALQYAAGNAFHLGPANLGVMRFGFYGTPAGAMDMVRAHYVTGRKEYLDGALAAAMFSSGGNPQNSTYTVGLGSRWPMHPLHVDSRMTGQPPPEGLTTYGNYDFLHWPPTWPMTIVLSKLCIPSVWDWPLTEDYFDIFFFPVEDEFTVDAWGPCCFVWGYFAARPSSIKEKP
jgi:endoglucanase